MQACHHLRRNFSQRHLAIENYNDGALTAGRERMFDNYV